MIDSLRLLFMRRNRDSKDIIAICRWHIAATSSKTGCHLNFCPSHARTKMQTSPFRCTKQIRGIPIRVSLLFVSPSGQEGTRRVQCNSPVDCCRRGLDRAEPLSAPLGSRCKRVLLRCIRRSIISYPLWINRGYNLQKHRKEYKVLSNDGLEFPFHLFRICGTLCDQFLNGQQYSVA